MSYEEFCKAHGFSPPFTEFYGLRKTLCEYLKLKTNEMIQFTVPNIPQFLSILLLSPRPGKNVYQNFLKKLYEKPKFETKWEAPLNISLSDEWWRRAHSCAVNFTNDTKLMWFQIRLTHRILSTNTFLSKIGVADSQLCSFCGEELEELVHLYWSCNYVQMLWTSLFHWINGKTNMSLNLVLEDILFGKFSGPKILNLIITLCKYHIYRRRLLKCRPCFDLLKIEINQYYHIEKYIFKTNCKLSDFNIRWAPMVLLFADL